MSKKIQQLLPLIPFPGPRAWLLLLAGKQQQCETRQLCKYKNMWTCNKIYARWNAAHARPGAATRVLRRSVAGLRKWRRQITAARRSREGRVPTEIKNYSFLLLFAWGSALRLWSAVWCIPRISMKLFNLCCGRQISTWFLCMTGTDNLYDHVFNGSRSLPLRQNHVTWNVNMILVDVFAVIIVFIQLWINKMTCDNWRLQQTKCPKL